MRANCAKGLVFIFALLVSVSRVGGQASASSSALPQIVQAYSGTAPLRTVSLTGNVTIPNASGQTAGTITLSASSNRWSEIDLGLPTGNQTEVRNGVGVYHQRIWIGPDGVAQAFPLTDLELPHPAWFFPSFVLLSALGSPNHIVSDLGVQTWQGSSARHISVWRKPPGNMPASSATSEQSQTQSDFYLDPNSYLPMAITFQCNANAQDPREVFALSNSSAEAISVEVTFSDYRSVQGSQIPFHIRVFNGNSLAMDISLSGAAINSDLVRSKTN